MVSFFKRQTPKSYFTSPACKKRLLNGLPSCPFASSRYIAFVGEDEVRSKVRFILQHDEKRGILKLKEKSIAVASQI